MIIHHLSFIFIHPGGSKNTVYKLKTFRLSQKHQLSLKTEIRSDAMTRYVSHGACKSCGATGTEGLLRVVSEPETTWCCIESGTCLEVTDDDGSLFAGRPVWECTSCLNNLCSFCMPLSFTEQHRFLYGVENIVGREVHLLKSFELNYDSSPPEIQFAERALITEARVLAAEMETLLL